MQFCHQRAKFHDGKKSYRYCGKICAAAAAVQAGAPNEDKICLMCRKAEKQPRSHFCSKTCVEEAEKKGPAILEVPVGHVTFISGESTVDVTGDTTLTFMQSPTSSSSRGDTRSHVRQYAGSTRSSRRTHH